MRLIDADELRKKFVDFEFVDGVRCDVDYYALKTIKDAPTIDAVPARHGKFIGTEYDGYADGNPVYYEWKCSVCGCIFEDEEPTYRYCPNCGARMDEE